MAQGLVISGQQGARLLQWAKQLTPHRVPGSKQTYQSTREPGVDGSGTHRHHMKLAQSLTKSERCNFKFSMFIFLTTQTTFDFPWVLYQLI